MTASDRYHIQIGNFLTEGFDATSEGGAEEMIADICTGRESISNLPQDTEVIITSPDGTSRTTTLEQCKRFR